MIKVCGLRGRGFTLIEILVTLAIMALLIFMAVPLSTEWTNSGQTLKARGTLSDGYAYAKALALRNPCAAPNATGNHAATLEASTNGTKVTLSVLAQGNPSNCTYLKTRPNPQWKYSLPDGVKLSRDGSMLVTGTPFNLTIDNRGQPSMSSEILLSLGAAKNDETIELH